LSLLSARYSYTLTSASVRRDLDLAFIDLIEAQDLLAISLDIEGRRRQQAEMVSLRYQAGREHRGSLLTAEANLASATLDVKIARRRFDLAQTNLARAIGRDESGALEAAGDLATPPEMPAPEFPELVREHPDVLKQEASLESADYDLKIARAGFFPSISGSGSIGRSGDDWPPGKESWGVGVSLSLPIFTGGSRLANIAGATAALEESRQNTRKTSQDTLYSLEQAWKNFEDAREEVRIQDLYLAADTERARISEAQYAIGLLSFDNWIIIEDNLVRTKKSHLTSRASSRRTLARWLYARALTLEDDLRVSSDSDILN
jgi:outer membrane protein TolC